jgi:uncharacterized membrane protein YidH (DUF202 family)
LKPLAIIGVVLIALGVLGLALEYVVFTETKSVIDAGPLKVTAKTEKRFPIPTIAGIVAVIAGLGLIYLSRRPASR